MGISGSTLATRTIGDLGDSIARLDRLAKSSQRELLLLLLLRTTRPAWYSIDDHTPDSDDYRLLQSNQDSLLWGTYRPQLYHGIRARIPKSLMTGLMWHGLNDYPSHRGRSTSCHLSDNTY